MTDRQPRTPEERFEEEFWGSFKKFSETGGTTSESAALIAQLQDERLRETARQDKYLRWILALGTWAIAVVILLIVIGAIIALGWHLLFPEWCWLDTDQLQNIKDVMLSGVAVGLGSAYLRKIIDRNS